MLIGTQDEPPTRAEAMSSQSTAWAPFKVNTPVTAPDSLKRKNRLVSPLSLWVYQTPSCSKLAATPELSSIRLSEIVQRRNGFP